MSCCTSPAAKAASKASCESNTRAGASMMWRSSGTADTLITARPRRPCSRRNPPVGENGRVTGRNTVSSPDTAGAPCPPAAMPPVFTLITSGCMKPPDSSSRRIHAGPPAAWNWFTSASPLGYTRASSGTADDSSSKSDQSIRMPALRAMDTQWIKWLVEPPVASRATIALTMQRSSTTRPMGVKRAPRLPMSSTVRTAWRVKASRSSVPGGEKARHDLVAHAQQQRAIEHIVGQRYRSGHGNGIAGKQRQLHAGRALRDAIAHGRHAACHLHRGAVLGGLIAQHGGVTLVGLVGRQHVVVGRDHADVGRLFDRDLELVRARQCRIGMGQIGTAHAVLCGLAGDHGVDACEVSAAGVCAALDNALGHARYNWVHGSLHRWVAGPRAWRRSPLSEALECNSITTPLQPMSLQTLPLPPSELGESPFWHPTEKSLYWCDIQGQAVHAWHPESGRHRQWRMPSEPGCCAPAAGGAFVTGFRKGFHLPDTAKDVPHPPARTCLALLPPAQHSGV